MLSSSRSLRIFRSSASARATMPRRKSLPTLQLWRELVPGLVPALLTVTSPGHRSGGGGQPVAAPTPPRPPAARARAPSSWRCRCWLAGFCFLIVADGRSGSLLAKFAHELAPSGSYLLVVTRISGVFFIRLSTTTAARSYRIDGNRAAGNVHDTK